jgi:hypothetical protein
MIVAHEVTNVGHDRVQPADMATTAQAAVGAKKLIALADRALRRLRDLLKAEQAGVAMLVPKPLTWNSIAQGRFDKRDFICLAQDQSVLGTRRAQVHTACRSA